MTLSKNQMKFLNAFEGIDHGCIKIKTPDGKKYDFDSKKAGPSADLDIKDFSVIDNLLYHGETGFGEDYINGLWDSENVPELLTFATVNSQALEKSLFHGKFFEKLSFALRHFLNRNSLKGSRRNIEYHYDLGNDFYELWLDPSMTYSSALYDGGDCIKKAQSNKYDRIINRLNKPGSILEIGCGWGGFAEKVIGQGHSLKGLTLSQEQAKYATERLKKNGSHQNTEIAIQDYRKEQEKYDYIVSIEMFEAVGEQYWKTYFDKIKGSLNADGKAVIQAITIDDGIFKTYRKRSDFIRKHIFPGGMLASPEIFTKIANNCGLSVTDSHNFGLDYAKTLYDWRKKFNTVHDKVKQLGFDDRFIRKWQFYFATCIAGFVSKRTDVYQFELQHQNK